jgi:Fe(II)/alpha-ketoglutarate-dependent arginine beta-hydroxylase
MYELTRSDADAVRRLTDEMVERFGAAESPELLSELAVWAHELPRGLRGYLTNFRLAEPFGAAVVRGYQLDDARVGLTPERWGETRTTRRTVSEEIYLLLCAALLGEPFGWATEQGGCLIHDVLPMRGHENEQIGTGSEQVITWHTEDAFNEMRGDYVGLMCMRNPDRVATTFTHVADVQVDDSAVKALRTAHYYIRPDNSHLRGLADIDTSQNGVAELAAAARARITSMRDNPQPVAVMFGADDAPYLRLDPYFMDLDRLEPDAREALEALSAAIDEALQEVVLGPGDVCFVDNYRAVHGRQSFRARFDGTDRWLKRINVTRDLRRSREARLDADARIIY